ncbi:TRAP transporter large permease subunit [Tropicibacter sp. Alg240-R139]|uniref:TRAP transporter large permease subunit n=1 Tax=Tropicibacter sp. Alg240-R139 TaxID=2305991 RepID=UPI0013E040BB|nr:TRAP transporter large permease subunit [Tropicibacter sp. Alg240-R139]
MHKLKNAALGAITGVIFAATSVSAEIVLNHSDSNPGQGALGHVVKWYAAELEKRSNGELKMNINWASSLLSAKDTLGGVQDGVAGTATLIPHYIPNDTRPILFADLPIVKPDAWVAPAFVDLVRPDELETWQFLAGVVEAMDLNLIWFGVVVVKLLEIGLVTPPLGLNVFVIANVVGKRASVEEAFSGIARFLVMDVAVIILLVAFPVLSLLLPSAVN